MPWPLPKSTLPRLVMLVIAYFLASAISRSLSVGQASPVWLPTGLGIAAILAWGYRMAPGILIGAVAFDAFVNTTWGNDQTAVWSGIGTGIGATVQALVAAVLLRRLMSDNRGLNIVSVRDALRFVVIAAFTCTISPTVGTTVLTSAHLVAPESATYFWATWWVGDICGTLLVAPPLLLLRQRSREQGDWRQFTLPIIGLGFGLTLIAAFLVNHLDREARLRDFSQNGAAIASAVDRAMELTVHDLLSSRVLFMQGEVSALDFHRYAEQVRGRNDRIESLSWAPRTLPSGVAALERKQRDEGSADFSVFELDPQGLRHAVAARDAYYPLVYLEPPDLRATALGFDVASDPRRSAAQTVALQTGHPAATGPLQLLGKERHQLSVVIYVPVYRNDGLGLATASQEALGFVTASVSIPALMRNTLDPFDTDQIETWLIDRSGADAPLMLYQSSGPRLEPGSPLPSLSRLVQGIHYAARFSVAGRDWMVICRPLDTARKLHAAGLIGVVLLGGIGFTLILATYMLTRQRNEAELRARDTRLLNQNAALTNLAQRPLATGETLQMAFRDLAVTSAITLQVARVGVWLLQSNNERLHCQCLYQQGSDDLSTDAVLEARDYPHYFAALLENRRIAANDAAHDPRTREFQRGYLKPLGIGAMLDAPIRLGGQLVGVICHEHVGPPRAWTLDEQNFAGSMGDMASLMMETARRASAERDLQAANTDLENKVIRRTEQLHAANEKLREIDRLKSMFIASMSHELRTPLNSIIGFSGVVLQGISGPINERQTDQLTRVFNSARHLLSLISDVIDISKIEAGYVDVFREAVKVGGVIDEALSTVQPQRTEKGLELATDIDPAVQVLTDRKRLLQCVLNLISNAVKYTEHGAITVRLRAGADRIVIEVQDTGIGIDENAQKRLFEPFERIDSHLRIKTPGTGLGLYLTRKIMTDLLDGGVEAESTPGVGSTFRLWLPNTPAPLDHPNGMTPDESAGAK